MDHGARALAADQLPETVMINQPRFTNPITGTGNQPAIQPPYSMQPKKSSKAWVWVLGILGVLVLLCGGGGAACGIVAPGKRVKHLEEINEGGNQQFFPESRAMQFDHERMQVQFIGF